MSTLQRHPTSYEIKLLCYLHQLLYLGILFTKQLLGNSDHLQSQLKTIYKDIKVYIECKIPVWLCFEPHKRYTSTGYALPPLILYIYIYIYSINVFKMKETPRIPDHIYKSSEAEKKRTKKGTHAKLTPNLKTRLVRGISPWQKVTCGAALPFQQ